MKNANDKNKKRKIAQLSLLMLGFLLVFTFGAFHKDNAFERVGEYITSVVTRDTKLKKYCAVSLDAKNKPGDYYGNEFSNLFDVFRSGVVTYASAMNANKEENITFNEIETPPLSFVFLGPVGTVPINDEKGDVICYRHYKYNFYTMYEDAQYNGSEFDKKHSPIIYLSKSQANSILKSRGVVRGTNEAYTSDDYASLIKSSAYLNFNGELCEYTIWNIYLDEVDDEIDNFYYSGIKDVLGEFVLTSYYQPSGHNLREIHKSLYFFNEYSYYNQYLMRYINERFDEEKPAINVVKNNIENEIDDNYFLSFYLDESIGNFEWVYYILLILSFSIIVGSIVLFFTNKTFSFKFIMLNVLVSFAPYLIFKFIYLITNDVLFFSRPSVKVAAIAQSIFILIILSVPIYRTISLNSEKADFYELDV